MLKVFECYNGDKNLKINRAINPKMVAAVSFGDYFLSETSNVKCARIDMVSGNTYFVKAKSLEEVKEKLEN